GLADPIRRGLRHLQVVAFGSHLVSVAFVELSETKQRTPCVRGIVVYNGLQSAASVALVAHLEQRFGAFELGRPPIRAGRVNLVKLGDRSPEVLRIQPNEPGLERTDGLAAAQ